MGSHMNDDPDYIDPEILEARAREKGNRPEDVFASSRPRIRRIPRGIRLSDFDASSVVIEGNRVIPSSSHQGISI